MPNTKFNMNIQMNTSHNIKSGNNIERLICVQIRILIPLLLLPCLPQCLHYAGSHYLMLWNKVVSNGLAGVLMLVNQMVFVPRVPKGLGGIYPSPYVFKNKKVYIYIYIIFIYLFICVHMYIYIYTWELAQVAVFRAVETAKGPHIKSSGCQYFMPWLPSPGNQNCPAEWGFSLPQFGLQFSCIFSRFATLAVQKSGQVLLSGIEAVMVLTSMVLRQRALFLLTGLSCSRSSWS